MEPLRSASLPADTLNRATHCHKTGICEKKAMRLVHRRWHSILAGATLPCAGALPTVNCLSPGRLLHTGADVLLLVHWCSAEQLRSRRAPGICPSPGAHPAGTAHCDETLMDRLGTRCALSQTVCAAAAELCIQPRSCVCKPLSPISHLWVAGCAVSPVTRKPGFCASLLWLAPRTMPAATDFANRPCNDSIVVLCAMPPGEPRNCSDSVFRTMRTPCGSALKRSLGAGGGVYSLPFTTVPSCASPATLSNYSNTLS